MFSFVFSFFFLIYSFFQSISIYGGDGGDLVTAAYTGGFAHPPGYPLYSLLGYLLTKIPLHTIAWRVSLLSSIPAALALAFLYQLLYDVTRSKFASLFAVCTLGLSYIYWLYAIVPEVFALNSLFMMILLYTVYRWSRYHKVYFLYIASLMFGLSLAHHHIILLILPSVFLILHSNRSYLRKIHIKSIMVSIALFLLGLAPYMWTYIATIRVRPIVWNDPYTLQNFIKLISRSQYGTFYSGITHAVSLKSRMLGLPIIWEFYLSDFTLLGIGLAFLGIVYIFIHKKHSLFFILIGFLFTGPFFFIYGSYYVTTGFHIGILERFLIPSYIFLSMMIGIGLNLLTNTLRNHLSKVNIDRKRIYMLLFRAVFIMLPVGLFFINYPKLSILKNDLTAERFGEDVLKTAEKGSIVMLETDNMLFDSQYVYYANPRFSHIKLIDTNKMIIGYSHEQIKKYYPGVYMPKNSRDSQFLAEFLEKNYNLFQIYSTKPLKGSQQDSKWIPLGLLYRYYKKEDVPSYQEITHQQEKLWASYSDPLKGSLGIYKNLLLANILDFYANARLINGVVYESRGDFSNAEKYYRAALRMSPQMSPAYFDLAHVLIAQKKCTEASRMIDIGHSFPYFIDYTYEYYLEKFNLYYSCFKDEKQARFWKKKIDEFQNKKEVKINKL